MLTSTRSIGATPDQATPRGQRGELRAQTGEERVPLNVECASPVIGKACEGWRKVAFATGLYNLQAQPKRACSRLLFSNMIFAGWNFGI